MSQKPSSCEIEFNLVSHPIDSTFKTILIVIFSLTSLFAMIGNVIVLIVYTFGHRTHINLRKFLINLAIADILTGVVCMPFTLIDRMLDRWIFPILMCPTVAFLQLLSVFVTSWTLVGIGIERYFALLRPFSSVHQFFRNHCNLFLAAIWLFGSIYTSWGTAMMHVEEETTTVDSVKVTYLSCQNVNSKTSPTVYKIYMIINFIITFAIPMTIIGITYFILCTRLINAINSMTNNNNAMELTSIKRKVKEESVNLDENPVVLEVNQDKPSFNIIDPALETVDPVKLSLESSDTGLNPVGQDSYPSSIPNREPNDAPYHENKSRDRQISIVSRTDSSIRRNMHSKATNSPNSEMTKVVKMMIALVVIFLLCTMPGKTYQLIMYVNPNLIKSHQINCSVWAFHHVQIIAHMSVYYFFMLHSLLNPIIYSFMSNSFRADFGQIFGKVYSRLRSNHD